MEYKEFGKYLIYENGDVFSLHSNRMMSKDFVHGYAQYTLCVDGVSKRYRAHRLVAMLFLDPPKNNEEIIVNHKDGNKLNNHYTNLEWCTYTYNNKHARDTGLNNISKSNHERWNNAEFRERTSKKFSNIKRESGMCAGKNNGRFRYLIVDANGDEHSRQQLATELGLSQSYTDALLKRSSEGEVVPYFSSYGITIIDTKAIKLNDYRKYSAEEISA